MQHLRELVTEINQAIAIRLKETARLNGLVRQIKRQKEGVPAEYANLDSKNNPVVIDDKWNINSWHRVLSIDSEEKTGRGKGKNYRMDANMILVCSSKSEYVHDLFAFVLSTLPNVTYESSDFDITRIIQQETGKRDVNIDRHLFQIKYTLSYLSQKSFDACEATPLPATTGGFDCIEVSQGGVLTP